MKISWNWLSELVDLKRFNGPDALARFVTDRGLEVESVERLDRGFGNVVTAQIKEFQKHPQADRLNVCQVVAGEGVPPVQVVCGGNNLFVGAKVAFAQPGAHLPNDLKIAVSKIRGVESHGMLCSEDELRIGNSPPGGILILPEATALGLPLARVLGREDTILHLKLGANRGDCMSHLGMAREIAAGLGTPLAKKAPSDAGTAAFLKECPISVRLEAGEDAPQFLGCFVRGVRVGPSPDGLVKKLTSIGLRSINNVVDATNWAMYEFGLPTHAYDAKKLRGSQITVRSAAKGEKLLLLDGAEVELDPADVVVADEAGPIALGGVMGGGNSEVSTSTTDVFLECAEFKAATVRKMAARHQRKTEAALRFEKGVDPGSAARVYVMRALAEKIVELAGGSVEGSVQAQIATHSSSLFLAKGNYRMVRFKKYFIHDFLGIARDAEVLSADKLRAIFLAHEFYVREEKGLGESADSEWIVGPPSYRLDLASREDIAEEVARTIGYDQIPATVPPLTGLPNFVGSSRGHLEVVYRAKESLVRSGMNESIHLSFCSRSWLEKLQFTGGVEILNPLSEEHRVLVPSLLPGLIQAALKNWTHHFGSERLPLRLFEVRPTFSSESVQQKAVDRLTTGVSENWKISFILSGPSLRGGLRCDEREVGFADVRGVLERLFEDLGTRGVRMLPLSESRQGGHSLFHPGQSVEIWIGSKLAGWAGLMHPGMSRDLKCRAPLWMAELDCQAVFAISRKPSEVPKLKPWPSFPQMERDFALVVKEEVTGDQICQLALKAGKPLIKEAKVFDVYKGAQVGEGMTSIAVRVIFYDEARSIEEAEAETASSRILASWKKELNAELRG